MTGTKVVNALSKELIVASSRDGINEKIKFSKGKFIKREEEKISKSEHGLFVSFIPDNEVLEEPIFDVKRIREMIKELSFLCKGLKFIYKLADNDKQEVYLSNGLLDYLNDINKGKELICDPIYFYAEDGKFSLEVALGYNNGYSCETKLYTNNIPQPMGGTHLTGFKTALTTAINQYARDKKLLKDKDENFTGAELEEGQLLILNFKMIDPVFQGQAKEKLTSTEGRTVVQQLASNEITSWLYKNPSKAKVIIEKAKLAKKAKESAKKARENVRKLNEDKGKSKLTKLPSKLVDCYGKDRSRCELYIVEGNSASGGMVGARNSEFQAVMPIRGKIISTYNNSLEKITKNAEVMDIIKAIGLDFDAKTLKLEYNKNKLRYGKIIFCADADPDGSHIKNLLFACIWYLCPELILNGNVYIAIPPLFRITTKKNEYIYLRGQKELDNYINHFSSTVKSVGRLKGIGEMSEFEQAECLLDEETRNIELITIEDKAKVEELLDIFMGSNADLRKDYIINHSEEARD